MKQFPIQSQISIPADKGMTSQILYREPTHEEMHGKKGTVLSNIFAWLFLILVFFGLGVMAIKIAERESANQVEAIVKAVEVLK